MNYVHRIYIYILSRSPTLLSWTLDYTSLYLECMESNNIEYAVCWQVNNQPDFNLPRQLCPAVMNTLPSLRPKTRKASTCSQNPWSVGLSAHAYVFSSNRRPCECHCRSIRHHYQFVVYAQSRVCVCLSLPFQSGNPALVLLVTWRKSFVMVFTFLTLNDTVSQSYFPSGCGCPLEVQDVLYCQFPLSALYIVLL